MAVYRQVYTSFWQDEFVLTLTPEEKYFYLYLITNSKTTLCGIYELPIRVAEFETGYSKETVEKYMKKFEKCNKIRFSEKSNEICIVNWIKHNINRSPKVKVALEEALSKVKDKSLIKFLYPMDTISSETETGTDTVSEPETKQPEQKENLKKDKALCDTKVEKVVVDEVVKYYQENIGKATPYIREDICDYLKQGVDFLLIMACISSAVEHNVFKWSYCKGMLKNLIRDGTTNMAQYEQKQLGFKAAKIKKSFYQEEEHTPSYDLDEIDKFWDKIPILI